MKSVNLLSIVLLLTMGCGGDVSPVLVQGDADVSASSEVVDLTGDVCAPACQENQCGPDGCGGDCGSCDAGEGCSDQGACLPLTCLSSVDCPGDLVCLEPEGICVECGGDEDCPPEYVCAVDHQCHLPITCKSDKDCKDFSMVCDKDSGICVQCLKAEHCEADSFCDEGFCVADLCVGGSAACNDNTASVCFADGSGWQVTEVCGEEQYCEDGECIDQVCAPGKFFCDDDVAKECNEIGSDVAAEEDCGEAGLNCFEGECIETICIPDSQFCTDDLNLATCAADGMEFSTEQCPAEHFCSDGECHPWVCLAGESYCVDSVAVTCNLAGSAVLGEEDCGAIPESHICLDGTCVPTVCSPDEVDCVDDVSFGECSADGLSFEIVECPEESFCADGVCVPWACSPGEAMCDGKTATVCDEAGSGPAPGGENCAEAGKGCVNGKCITCTADCFGKDCGNDGCGGSCGGCDDDYPCTEDVCVNSVFSCTHTQIQGCCANDGECQIENSCFEATCENLECVYVPMECDDADDCSKDFCYLGTCMNPPVLDAGCCPNVIYSEDFEMGVAWGWEQLTGAMSMATSSEYTPAHTGNWSVLVGGADKNEVRLPITSLPMAKSVTLSFWLRTKNYPGNCSLGSVQVFVNGAKAYENCEEVPDWALVTVDLSSWAGQEVDLRIYSANKGNPGKPAYLDDLKLTTECCSQASDCDDGNPCTTDSCGNGGGCLNVLQEGCCQPVPWTEGFETGVAWNWEQLTGYFSVAADNEYNPAHTGDWSVLVGGSDKNEVRLPITSLPMAKSVTLSFWLRTKNYPGNCSLGSVQVFVNGAKAYENCEEVPDWALVTVDLSSWAGQEVDLRIYSANKGNPGKPAYLDDLKLTTECCSQASDCDDGNPCTADSCGNGGGCLNVLQEGCCQPVQWTEGFETGVAWGWENLTTGLTVFLANENQPAHTGDWAALISENSGTGEVRLPVTSLPGPEGVALSFWMHNLNFTGNCAVGRLRVYVNGSLAHEVCDNLPEWTLVTADLSPWKGQVVDVRLSIYGSSGNQSKVAYLDDLKLTTECCSQASDCDDGNPCTTDSCGNGGGCLNVLQEGCCQPVPWTEDFEMGVAWGWENLTTNLTVYLANENQPAHSGDWLANLSKSNGTGEVRLPITSLPSNEGVTLSFWMWNMNYTGSCTVGRLRVYVNGSLAHQVCDNLPEWTLVTADLSPWAGQVVDVRLSVYGSSGNQSKTVYLDDLKLSVDCCGVDPDCGGG